METKFGWVWNGKGTGARYFAWWTPSLTGSEHIVAGLTIFDPGEASAYHNHPGSEEVDFIVRGNCKAVWGSEGTRV